MTRKPMQNEEEYHYEMLMCKMEEHLHHAETKNNLLIKDKIDVYPQLRNGVVLNHLLTAVFFTLYYLR